MTEKSPDTLMMEDEGLETILRAVERLPEAYRSIIALLSEGKRPHEIAEILGCSTNAATIRCCRARNQCRARAESCLALAKMDFRQPALLSDAEISEIIGKADDLSKWAALRDLLDGNMQESGRQ